MVLALVEETPDMMLAEIAAHLESEHGLRVSQSTVWRFFHRRGITFKKAQLVNRMRYLVTAAARQARSLAPGARATRWNQLR